jgi:hypothetical protein
LKTARALLPGLFLLAVLSCSSGGPWEPVVIDLSVTKTPTPAAAPTSASAAAAAVSPTPHAVPPSPVAPTATPVPAPAPPVVEATKAPAPAPAPASAPPAAKQPAVSAGTPESVAQAWIEAYNRRDLEALVSLFAPNAQIFEPPDRLRDSGAGQIRQACERRFASAGKTTLSAAGRIVEGNIVTQRETETGADGRVESAIVTREVRDGRIVRVWIAR